MIDRLPDGYALFDRPRGTDPTIVSLCPTMAQNFSGSNNFHLSVIDFFGDIQLDNTSPRYSSSFHIFTIW